jgi:hypothetical protein
VTGDYIASLELQAEIEERTARGEFFSGVLDEKMARMGGLGSATEITAGFVELFGMEVEEAAAETFTLAEALGLAVIQQENLADVTREAIDPTFKAIRAVGRMRDAAKRYDDVMADATSTTDEQNDAWIDLIETQLAADSALQTFGVAPIDQMQALADLTGRTEEEIRALFESAGLLDGLVFNWKIVLDAEDARRELAEFIEGDEFLRGVSTTFIPRNDLTEGGITTRAQGGTFNVGQTTLVGEEGPELVVPAHRDRIFSNADTRRMLSSGGSVTQNITLQSTGDTAQDAQVAAIMLANRNHIRGGMRGGAF